MSHGQEKGGFAPLVAHRLLQTHEVVLDVLLFLGRGDAPDLFFPVLVHRLVVAETAHDGVGVLIMQCLDLGLLRLGGVDLETILGNADDGQPCQGTWSVGGGVDGVEEAAVVQDTLLLKGVVQQGHEPVDHLYVLFQEAVVELQVEVGQHFHSGGLGYVVHFGTKLLYVGDAGQVYFGHFLFLPGVLASGVVPTVALGGGDQRDVNDVRLFFGAESLHFYGGLVLVEVVHPYG